MNCSRDGNYRINPKKKENEFTLHIHCINLMLRSEVWHRITQNLEYSAYLMAMKCDGVFPVTSGLCAGLTRKTSRSSSTIRRIPLLEYFYSFSVQQNFGSGIFVFFNLWQKASSSQDSSNFITSFEAFLKYYIIIEI